MVHARVVRPPRYGARLNSRRPCRRVEKMPGVLKVVRDGSYLAVVAAKEFQAIKAMKALARPRPDGTAPELPGGRERGFVTSLKRPTSSDRRSSSTGRWARRSG